MKVNLNHGNAVVSVDILDLNSVELKQMYVMRKRIAHVLKTHQSEEEKNEYLTDDELKDIWAMLSVFTEDYAPLLKSSFDEYLERRQPNDD